MTLELAFGYRFLCIKIIDYNVKMFGYNETYLWLISNAGLGFRFGLGLGF